MGRLKYRLRLSRVSCRELPPASQNEGSFRYSTVANEYAEGILRAAARAHGPTAHYRYSALVPKPVGLHPMPAMAYADGGMVVTGDHVGIDPHFTAQRNALFLAGSAIPHALESVCQVVEYEQRCALFYDTVRPPRGWDRILEF